MFRGSYIVSDFFHYFGLLTLVTALPTSKFLMTLAVIFLGTAWLIRGDYKSSIRRMYSQKTSLVLMGFYIFHVIGMLYTSNTSFGMNDLRVKLPLLLLPFILAGLPPISLLALKRILLFYAAVVIYTTMYNVAVRHHLLPTGKDISDLRNASVFISHVRLNLHIVFVLSVLIWYQKGVDRKYRWIFLAGIIWLIFYLFYMQAFGGLVLLTVLCLFFLARIALLTGELRVRFLSASTLLIIVLGSVWFINQSITRHFTPKEDPNKFETHTLYGEKYIHNLENPVLENGYYIWSNVAPAELDSGWSMRSSKQLSGVDGRGNPLHSTLIRYMTSKGLKKDLNGINQLTDTDIENVEKGVASVLEFETGLIHRVDQVLFEIDVYFYGGNPSGNSITQRLEYWQAGLSIIASHPFGVGTGDDKAYFVKELTKRGNITDEEYQKRSHNQWIGTGVILGIPGILFLMITLFLPLIWLKNKISPLYLAFIVTILISFIWEDTLETQEGVTFYSLFNALLLFGADAFGNDKSS